MKRIARIVLVASAALLDAPVDNVGACGASAVSDVGELLAPPRTLVSELLSDAWDGYDLLDFRFLHPFELAGRDPHGFIARAYGYGGEASGAAGADIDLSAFEKALGAADLTLSANAARDIVRQVLDMPAPIAQENGAALQRAVEFLELLPVLENLDKALLTQFFVQRSAGPLSLPPVLVEAQKIRDTARAELPALLALNPKQPRAASLELVRLGERVHHEVPDGWPGQIALSASAWASLEEGYDAWLRANPQHPLADLAQLAKLRVLFLRGDGTRAWNLLFGMYPRHTLRVAWEMRHLMLSDLSLPRVDLTKLKDPVLATALLRESLELSPAAWSALWKVSAAAGAEAWATNLQERLFVQAMRLANAGAAPPALPGAPSKRTSRWAVLHAAALSAAGRTDEALAQARLVPLKDDRVAAAVLAQIYVQKCDWTHAAEVAPQLGADTLKYMLDVLVDDATLRGLAARPDALGLHASRALSMRLVADHRWQAAAEVWSTRKSKEARVWLDAARRSEDISPDGRLAFARFLRSAEGAVLFPDVERYYSRGLKRRLETLTDPPEVAPKPAVCGLDREHERLTYVLLYGGRRERALALYGDALNALEPGSRRTRALVKEADALYNKLLNWDVSMSDAFAKLLASSPAASALREAGKRALNNSSR